MPGSIKGGVVTFDLVNKGRIARSFNLIKFRPGDDADDLNFGENIEIPPAAECTGCASVNGLGGDESRTERLRMTMQLDPGIYAFHDSEGQVLATREFRVEGRNSQKLPKPDASIRQFKSHATVSPSRAGHQSVKLENVDADEGRFTLIGPGDSYPSLLPSFSVGSGGEVFVTVKWPPGKYELVGGETKERHTVRRSFSVSSD